jgi:hypothetical protein
MGEISNLCLPGGMTNETSFLTSTSLPNERGPGTNGGVQRNAASQGTSVTITINVPSTTTGTLIIPSVMGNAPDVMSTSITLGTVRQIRAGGLR